MDFADHDFEFTSLTDGRWLLTNPSRGYAFKINEYTMMLVRSLCRRRCWSEAYESYCSDTSTELTLGSYESEVTEILKKENRAECQTASKKTDDRIYAITT